VTWERILNWIFVLWGAGLSTYLGIRELRKEKRNLAIFLEHIFFYERVYLRLVNTGHRPITINSIAMAVYEADDKVNPPHWEEVPGNRLIDIEREDGTDFLPARLEDGEQVAIPLRSVVSDILIRNNLTAKILIKDADGHEYTKFKVSRINPKSDAIPPVR
jgi:hypothetical protein